MIVIYLMISIHSCDGILIDILKYTHAMCELFKVKYILFLICLTKRNRAEQWVFGTIELILILI